MILYVYTLRLYDYDDFKIILLFFQCNNNSKDSESFAKNCIMIFPAYDYDFITHHMHTLFNDCSDVIYCDLFRTPVETQLMTILPLWRQGDLRRVGVTLISLGVVTVLGGFGAVCWPNVHSADPTIRPRWAWRCALASQDCLCVYRKHGPSDYFVVLFIFQWPLKRNSYWPLKPRKWDATFLSATWRCRRAGGVSLVVLVVVQNSVALILTNITTWFDQTVSLFCCAAHRET